MGEKKSAFQRDCMYYIVHIYTYTGLSSLSSTSITRIAHYMATFSPNPRVNNNSRGRYGYIVLYYYYFFFALARRKLVMVFKILLLFVFYAKKSLAIYNTYAYNT